MTTIETLKAETVKLSKLEKLEFMQFLLEVLSTEERALALTSEQERTLHRRLEELQSGRVQPVPAPQVKAKLVKKYGLQA
ncbi:MAG: addiction module protein [Saprospiraceae bacterium]|nr:addiction module protein [Saprospiraceae bacterium]